VQLAPTTCKLEQEVQLLQQKNETEAAVALAPIDRSRGAGRRRRRTGAAGAPAGSIIKRRPGKRMVARRRLEWRAKMENLLVYSAI